jgi:hypothetical protein
VVAVMDKTVFMIAFSLSNAVDVDVSKHDEFHSMDT